MIIHLFAPFFSGSHRRWAEEYARHSKHQVRLFTLPGFHWKWRMHGAAVQLAEDFLAQEEQPDLLLTTDMLDTATFLSLTRARTASLPVAVYFHENQITYPWSTTDRDVAYQRDRHYGWLNYTSALAADVLLFNSHYHQESFLTALPVFLNAFPDYKGLANVARIADKAMVRALGMELRTPSPAPRTISEEPPAILWNHRWEYDKNPEAFFRICQQLKKEGVPFRLIVLGEQYAKAPKVFKQAQKALAHEIIHWGFVPDRTTYLQWLARAAILPVTSNQDFFGGSIVEAMYHGVYPLLPNRLAYPEHIPTAFQAQHLYQEEEELLQKLRRLLLAFPMVGKHTFRNWVAHYDWHTQAKYYDETFSDLVRQKTAGQ